MKFRKTQRTAPIPVTRTYITDHPDGSTCIYDCVLSSTSEPSIVNKTTGTEMWYFNGLIHRDGGSAITTQMGSFWFKNGVYHRSDGPAIELTNGTKEWYLEGVKVEPF
jgi:hypothetical protein